MIDGKAIRVQLPESWMRRCDEVAARRTARARRLNRREVYGDTGEDRELTDRIGVLGEGVFAYGIGWDDWDPADDLDYDGDVGPVGIRATRVQDGRLIAHAADKDNKPFALVILGPGNIGHIIGWHWGWFCKNEEWWWKPRADKAGGYFVPQGDLRKYWRWLRLLMAIL